MTRPQVKPRVGPARVADRFFDERETLHAPDLIDLEVAQVLRRYDATGELSAERATQALEDLATLVTRDARLARVQGVAARVEVP